MSPIPSNNFRLSLTSNVEMSLRWFSPFEIALPIGAKLLRFEVISLWINSNRILISFSFASGCINFGIRFIKSFEGLSSFSNFS